MTEKKKQTKKYKYDRLTLVVKDALGVKHNYVINSDTLYVIQTKFEAQGVNFMKFLIDNAEQKKIILTP